MAKRLVEELTDDIDGSKAERTVTFAFEGQGYEIELSKKNITALTKSLSPWIEAARKAGHVKPISQKKATRRGISAPANRIDRDAIRTWAEQNGYRVAERGRIAASVIDAYEAASR